MFDSFSSLFVALPGNLDISLGPVATLVSLSCDWCYADSGVYFVKYLVAVFVDLTLRTGISFIVFVLHY